MLDKKNEYMPHRAAKHIYNAIQQANKVLIVPHQDPDGDALGSVSAMAYFLDIINKPYSTYCSTETSPKLSSLPHLVNLSQNSKVWKDSDHDLILVLDSGDLEYAGIQKHVDSMSHDPVVVNIDHHPTNSFFGHHNLVITHASSTTEILYQFFKYNNIGINKNMAVSLLIGIITDTENFSNPGTTENSLKIASDLIHKGANFNLVRAWFLKDKPVNSLKLWGTALSRLAKHEDHDIVFTYITQKDLTDSKTSESETDGIANFLNNMNEGKASFLLREIAGNKVKGSLRTTGDDIDVSAIAQAMGGGGHKKASGFVYKGTIDETLGKIWQAFEKTA